LKKTNLVVVDYVSVTAAFYSESAAVQV